MLNDPAKLGSWLYAIAHRTSLDFAKKKQAKAPAARNGSII
ncbi:hypothetical protein OHJ21_25675 [Virgibacillus sp. LDC1]|nr:hypothetical protein [Virgibacillus sp. LDC1]MDL1164120.1 hypothetical protein [Yersinia pestis]